MTPQDQLKPQEPDVDLSDAIEQLRIKKGIPRPLVDRLVKQESGGNERAVSPNGAQGSFQVMPATFDLYNKKVGGKLNRDNPLDRAYVGLSLLQDNYKQFKNYAKSDQHNWGMALAAYHANPNSVMRDLRRGGNGIPDTNDGLINTRDYVFSILNGTKPEDFQVETQQPDVPRETSQIESGMAGQAKTPKVTSEVREPETPERIKFQQADNSELNKLARSVQGLTEQATTRGLQLPKNYPNLVGQRLTAKFDHPPTADEVDDAVMENLGKGYGSVAQRFRAETGIPLTANNVSVEKQPDGSYLAHARTSQGFVDAVNAYAQGGRSAYENTLTSQQVGKGAVARDVKEELKKGEGVGQDIAQAGAREIGRTAQFAQNAADLVRGVDPQDDPNARAIARASESIPSQKTWTGAGYDTVLSAAGGINRAEALGGAPMFPLSAAVENAEKGPEAAYKSALMTAPILAAGPIAKSVGVDAMSPVARQAASRGIAGATMAAPAIASGASPSEVGKAALEGAAFPIGRRGEVDRPTELDVRNQPVYGVQGRGALDADRILAEREAAVRPPTQPEELPAMRVRGALPSQLPSDPITRPIQPANTRGAYPGGPPVGERIVGPTKPLAPEAEVGAKLNRWQHRDFGLVTETFNQAGVGKDRVRVLAEDGTEHVIQRPKGTGAGNQIAVPVRRAKQPIDERAAEESARAEENAPFKVVDRRGRSEEGAKPVGTGDTAMLQGRGNELPTASNDFVAKKGNPAQTEVITPSQSASEVQPSAENLQTQAAQPVRAETTAIPPREVGPASEDLVRGAQSPNGPETHPTVRRFLASEFKDKILAAIGADAKPLNPTELGGIKASSASFVKPDGSVVTIEDTFVSGKPTYGNKRDGFTVTSSEPTAETPQPVKPETSTPTAIPESPQGSELQSSAVSPERIPEQVATTQANFPDATTSATRASMAKDRAELDLPELPLAERKSWQTSLGNAKGKGLDKRADLTAARILKNPRPLNDEETAGLVLRAQEIKNEHNRLILEGANETDKGKRNEIRQELEILEEQFDRITEATKLAGTEKGRALAAQKLTINQDFDLVSMLNRYKSKTGKEPSPEIRAKLEKQAERIADLEKQIASRSVEPAITKLQREVRRERRQATRKVLDEEAATIKTNIAAEFARLKSQRQSGTGIQPLGLASLDPEGVVTKLALKYVRNRVEAGITDTAQLVDDVHAVLSEFVDGVTKRQVAEMISGYNRIPQGHRSELQKQLDDLKANMRRELAEADVAAGVRSERREGPAKPRSEGPRATKDAIQKRYASRIADLERRIREEDFSTKPKRGPTVLDAETQKLADQLQKTKSEYERLVERNKPWSWLNNLSSIRKSGMLSGFLTHVRNITGTGAYQGFEEVRRLPSVVGDAALSTFTGRRTTTLSPSAMLDSVVHAVKVGGKEAGEILTKGATREQLEKQQLREINTGVKAIDLAFNSVFRVMSASDRVFYQQAYRRNLLDRALAQAKTEARADKSIKVKERAKELSDEPPITMNADAKHDALVSTFNNNNRLSDAVKSARARLGAGGNFALDMVLPFDRTPTNVIARVIEASPGGYVKNAGQLAKSVWNRSMSAKEQRAIAETFGRATTGTSIMTLGFALAAKGLIETDDYGTAYLKVGKRKINLNAVAPIGSLLGVGANLQKQHSKDEPTVRGYTGAVAKPIADQPLLRASSQISDLIKDPERNAAKIGAGLAFSAVPFSGAVRTVGEVIDPAEKRYPDSSFKQQFQKNFPKWRESLPSEKKGDFQKQLLEQKRSGADVDLDSLVAQDRLTPSQQKSIEKQSQMTPFQVRFENANADKALARYKRLVETNDPRAREVEPIMVKKAWSLIHSDSLTQKQKDDFQRQLDELGIVPKNPQQRKSNNFVPSFRSRFTQRLGAP